MGCMNACIPGVSFQGGGQECSGGSGVDGMVVVRGWDSRADSGERHSQSSRLGQAGKPSLSLECGEFDSPALVDCVLPSAPGRD